MPHAARDMRVLAVLRVITDSGIFPHKTPTSRQIMAFKLLGGHHEYAHMQCKQLSNNEQGEVAASYR